MADPQQIKTVNQFEETETLSAGDFALIDQKLDDSGSRAYKKFAAEKLRAGGTGTVDFNANLIDSAAGTGSFFAFGGIKFSVNDTTINQAGTTQTFGGVNSINGMHAYIVASAVGTSDKTVGNVEIEVSGTSLNNDGTTTPADTEVVLANIEDSTVIVDAYFETAKKWLGQITFTIQNDGTGDAVNFAMTFNYGMIAYTTADNLDTPQTASSLEKLEINGRATANDPIDLLLIAKTSSGWSYSAAAFVGLPSTAVVDLANDLGADNLLKIGEDFSYRATTLSTLASAELDPADSAGFLVQIITATAATYLYCNITVGLKLT